MPAKFKCGHVVSPDNTIVKKPYKYTSCRTCNSATSKRYREQAKLIEQLLALGKLPPYLQKRLLGMIDNDSQ